MAKKGSAGAPSRVLPGMFDQGDPVVVPLWTEPPVLDLPAAQQAREVAIAAVDDHADVGFRDQAFLALDRLARRQARLIVDDVWTELRAEPMIESTSDKRAMGAVMQRGFREGLIRPTQDFQASAQRQCHANPRRVWASLVCESWGPR